MEKFLKNIKEMPDTQRLEYITKLREALHALSPLSSMPIDNVIWVSIDKVSPNDYNPNSVAQREMGLLYKSIDHDGYTQPIVTIYDKEKDKYIIVDGFHRYFVCKTCKDIQERTKGFLPIVVIKKDINDRMASTVRHNRARGEHSIDGMSSMVFNMLKNGWSDEAICNELGMEAEELLKLKHITGFSKLFENVEFSKAWKTDKMIAYEKEDYNGTTC
jgi:ParB-like chromosome segregation protein Spo0J